MESRYAIIAAEVDRNMSLECIAHEKRSGPLPPALRRLMDHNAARSASFGLYPR